MSIKKEMEETAQMLSVLSRKPDQPELFGGGKYNAIEGIEQQERAEAAREIIAGYFLSQARGERRPSAAWIPVDPAITAQRQMLLTAVVCNYGEEAVSENLDRLVDSFLNAAAHITRPQFDNIALEIGMP